jgi:uncharacterized membrane protein YbhN (UPF0104 family)
VLTKITSHPLLKLILKVSLLAFCLIFIKTKLSYEFSYFLETIYRLNISFLFLSLISLLLSFFLGAYKWKILFNTFHPKSQFTDFLKACFKGAFIANFMFGSLVGDGARIYDISKKYKISYKRSLVIGILDRLLTLFFYGISIAFVFFVTYYTNSYSSDIQCMVFLSVLIALSIFIYKRSNSVLKLRVQKYSDLLSINFFALYFSTALLSTLLIGLSFIFLSNAVFIALELNSFTYVLTGLLSNFFPLSFSGWGVRELTLSFILKEFASSDAIITISILFGILNALIALPGALIYFNHRKV